MVGIIIVSWGRKQLLEQTLQTLFANTIQPNVCIVDNGSDPDTVEVIERFRSQMGHVCLFAQNEGKPHALNYGIRFFEKFPEIEYLLLCDNDIVFLPGWYDKMLVTYRAFERYKLHDRLTFGALSGFNFNNRGSAYHCEGQQVLYKSYPSGCCLMMSKKVIKANGYFDEKRLIKTVDTSYLSDMNHNKYYSGEIFPESVIQHAGANQRCWDIQTGEPNYIK